MSRYYDTIMQGEDKTLSLVAHDPPDSENSADVFDLTGASIEVIFIDTKDGRQLVTKTGTITVAASGTYTVSLTDSDTDDWVGRIRFVAKATVSGTTTKIGSGRLGIESDGCPALADYGR